MPGPEEPTVHILPERFTPKVFKAMKSVQLERLLTSSQRRTCDNLNNMCFFVFENAAAHVFAL